MAYSCEGATCFKGVRRRMLDVPHKGYAPPKCVGVGKEETNSVLTQEEGGG